MTDNASIEYRLFLCTPSKVEIAEIDYSSLRYSPRFDSFNELEFSMEYYYKGSDMIENTQFDLIKSVYLIYMKIYSTYDQSLIKEEYFTIIQPNDDGMVEFKKHVQCKSYAYACFNAKILRGYGTTENVVYPNYLYDNSGGTNGIINFMLTRMYNTWTVNYVSPSLLNVSHLLKFDKNTYTDVFSQLQKDYNCFFVFNTINNQINIYSADEYGANTGLVLSDENFIQNIKKEDVADNITTRLYVYGKDSDINISRYNITGEQYIDNFDYFLNNGYFSSSLALAYNNYKIFVASQGTTFNGYISAWDALDVILTTKTNELSVLNNELAIIQDAMDVITNAQKTNNAEYNAKVIEKNAKSAAIVIKEAEIASTQLSIDTIRANIAIFVATLSWESKYTLEQRQELINFVFEDSLEMSSVIDELQLYEYATQYITLKSQMPISLDIDSADLFSIYAMKGKWLDIKIGDFINIDCEKLGYSNYPIRLISYDHDPFNNSLSFKFSNSNELNTSIVNLNKIFKLAVQSATILEVKKDDISLYKNNASDILTNTSTIDAADNTIIAGNNYINRRGFIGQNLSSYGDMQIRNDKIIFSPDAWTTFYTLLSAEGLYLVNSDNTSRTMITPTNGFQIDQWNPALPGTDKWGNVVSIGTDGQVHIDNGYIKLTKIFNAKETNQILIDPSTGIQIRKNRTPDSPTADWFDVLHITDDGDLELSDENGNGIILDQFGLDTKFIKWAKNMAFNSSFELIAPGETRPLYWSGGIVTTMSSWFGSSSMQLNAGVISQQRTETINPCPNPQWYAAVGNIPFPKTRVSFHKKRGACKIVVLDASDPDNEIPFTLTAQDGSSITGTSGTSLTYPSNVNWEAASYSVVFTHGASTSIRVKFENDESVDECYIDAVIIEPDYTKRPSFYSDGPFSMSAGTIGDLNTYVQAIYVQPDEPTEAVEKNVWIDTDDYSRYDKLTCSISTLLTISGPEFVVATVAGITLTLPSPVGATGVLSMINNASTGIVIISGLINSVSSMNLFPDESLHLISDGTKWRS